MPGSEPQSELVKFLWKHGIEWNHLDLRSQYNWNFSNLQDAFEEGGVLHGQKVYLFTSKEPQALSFPGQLRIVEIPAVVAIVSPLPPSDKVNVISEITGTDVILDMKQMNLDWVPFNPLGRRGSSAERLKSQIYILSCDQRRARFDHFNKSEYCVPYFHNPFKGELMALENTSVDIVYPNEPNPVVCEYDWAAFPLEDFIYDLIADGELFEYQRDDFKQFVREKVREQKRADQEAKETLRNAEIAELSEEEVAAYHSMRFYKFYPIATHDTPDISHLKSLFINMYYGRADEVF